MGFSLSRALAGAAMGAAHSAGEIFDGMIAEERKTREADAAMQRQLDVATQLQTHADELTGAREVSRDALKEARAKKDRDETATQMQGIRTKVKAMGIDPDTNAGLRAAAGLADEQGYTAIADKFRVRSELERSHMANEEDRKLRAAALGEARATRKREGMDAEDKAAMNSIIRVADRLTVPPMRDPDTNKPIGDPDKDAANAALAWAESENAKGRSWKAVRSDLTQIIDGFGKQPAEIKKLPASTRFNAALDFWNMPEDKRRAPPKVATPTPPLVPRAQTASTVPERRGFLGTVLGVGVDKPFDPNAEPALGD